MPKAATITCDDGKTITMGQRGRGFACLATHVFRATMDRAGGVKSGTKSWNVRA